MTTHELIHAINVARILRQAEELERQILQREGTFDYDAASDNLDVATHLLMGADFNASTS